MYRLQNHEKRFPMKITKLVLVTILQKLIFNRCDLFNNGYTIANATYYCFENINIQTGIENIACKCWKRAFRNAHIHKKLHHLPTQYHCGKFTFLVKNWITLVENYYFFSLLCQFSRLN